MRAPAIVIATLLGLSAFAQDYPALSRATFDTTETYTMQRVSGYFKHPDGGDVALIMVRAESTGTLYRVAMRHDSLKEIVPGDTVTVEPPPMP